MRKSVQKESSYTLGFLTFSLILASWDGLSNLSLLCRRERLSTDSWGN